MKHQLNHWATSFLKKLKVKSLAPSTMLHFCQWKDENLDGVRTEDETEETEDMFVSITPPPSSSGYGLQPTTGCWWTSSHPAFHYLTPLRIYFSQHGNGKYIKTALLSLLHAQFLLKEMVSFSHFFICVLLIVSQWHGVSTNYTKGNKCEFHYLLSLISQL